MWLRLLAPGLRIKRWLFLIALSIAVLSYGAGSLFRRFVFASQPDPIILALTLQWLRSPYRDIILVLFSLALFAIGNYGLLRTLTAPFQVPTSGREWVVSLVRHQQIRRGPTVTVVGQGPELADALRGLKRITSNLTAVFAVNPTNAGPSEIMTAAMPCILSLSELEPEMHQILSYDVQKVGKAAGNVGDIFLSAAMDVSGNIESGLQLAAGVLAMRGQVIPAMRQNGEGTLVPSDEAVRAIMDTDLLFIVSRSPELLGQTVFNHAPLARAAKLSRGLGICLLPTSDVAGNDDQQRFAQLDVLKQSLGERTVQFALADGPTPNGANQPFKAPQFLNGIRLYTMPLADPENPEQYSPGLLADAVLTFVQTFVSPQRRRWQL